MISQFFCSFSDVRSNKRKCILYRTLYFLLFCVNIQKLYVYMYIDTHKYTKIQNLNTILACRFNCANLCDLDY